jgi:site-specific recombinase XerD
MANKNTARDLQLLLHPWLGLVAQRSEATARNYRVACQRFIDYVGDRALEPAVLVEYQQDLAETLSAGSQAMHISATRSFLRMCQSEGLVDKSPVEWLRRPKVMMSPHNRWLTIEELRALMQAASDLSPVHRALLLLLWTTGKSTAGAREGR